MGFQSCCDSLARAIPINEPCGAIGYRLGTAVEFMDPGGFGVRVAGTTSVEALE
jgi:hypothetical protein